MGEIQGLRLVGEKWIVLDFRLGDTHMNHLFYRYDTRLISVPDLRPGPACVSNRPFRGGAPLLPLAASETGPAEKHNDAECQDVLQATGTASVEDLEILIYRRQDLLPPAVQQSSRDLQATEDDFFRGWGDYPYYLSYYENPPFESSSHRWYGLYGSHDRDFYALTIFDSEGREQKRETIHHLLCGDSSLEKRGSACGCRVVDVSEERQDLLAFCRTQNGDYAGIVRRDWLAVLHTDDLSGAGFIELSHKYQHETLEEIALGDGRPYVVTLELGEMLRIYAIPGRP